MPISRATQLRPKRVLKVRPRCVSRSQHNWTSSSKLNVVRKPLWVGEISYQGMNAAPKLFLTK